jgi:hypothetical protein
MIITDMPQQLDNKLPRLESRLADPKTVQDGLLIPHVANGAPFVHVLQNHPSPYVDCYSFVPDLPHKTCFFFPPPFGLDRVPIHPKFFRKNVSPLDLNKHKRWLSRPQDASSNFGSVLHKLSGLLLAQDLRPLKPDQVPLQVFDFAIIQ